MFSIQPLLLALRKALYVEGRSSGEQSTWEVGNNRGEREEGGAIERKTITKRRVVRARVLGREAFHLYFKTEHR